MKHKTLTIAAAAGLAAFTAFTAGPARAADLFNLRVDVLTPTAASGSATFNTITGLADSLQTQNLSQIISAYTQRSQATAVLSIRGLPATVSYQANSPVLRFIVPKAGVDVNFNGLTRDASQILFRDFLLKNGGGLGTKILQALVANSPIDPIAGNPNSMQNTSAHADFGIGTGIGVNGGDAPPAVGVPTSLASMQPGLTPSGGGGGVFANARSFAATAFSYQPNLAAVGGDIGISNSGGFTSTVATMPLRYTYAFSDPRYAITVDAPITYINTAGAGSYFGSLGIAVRLPLMDNWYLTPNVRFGGGGSIDLGAGALQYSAGLASRYDMFVSDLRVTVGNGITLAKTVALQVGPVNVNYDLTNYLFNNGVQVEGSLPYQVFGQPTSWQAYLIDTTVAGTPVYVNHYDEIGISVGTRAGQNTQNWNSLRVGAAAVVGSRYNAFKLAFSARF